MLRAVETAHAALALHPDATVQELVIDLFDDGNQVTHMAPILADKNAQSYSRYTSPGDANCC